MMVEYCGSEFDVPDLIIDKFLKDFDALPGSKYRQGIYELRDTIEDVLSYAAEEPEILDEPEYQVDFIRALAMRQAMSQLGILHDA
jgi:hypothetical protein